MKKLVAILTVMVIGTLSANAAGLVWGTSTAWFLAVFSGIWGLEVEVYPQQSTA
jgi:predicted Co/Zn/Cd cation transporter (cation efflux family)